MRNVETVGAVWFHAPFGPIPLLFSKLCSFIAGHMSSN